ncbi:MAG: ribonuclease H-like domain-containing protein, partial [Gorillibacterium sp.]|nr:ribonuclease H-like domain-containing protein [Gorillibacterium sp.]
MSGLKDRLNRLKTSSRVSSSINPADGLLAMDKDLNPNLDMDTVESDMDSMESDMNAMEPGMEEWSRQALRNEWIGLEAEYVENEWGSFIKRTRRFPLSHRHGCYELGEIAATGGKLGSFSASRLPASTQSLLYFDTETTGLGHGAGNVAFMLGIGFYREDEFVIEQLFIRNPAEELAMLAYFGELAAGFTHLVTYNGKAFDWPLLQGRYIMNRLKLSMHDPLHLDFLHPSRSLWKHTLPSCRLGKVEEELLGFSRFDDLPGAMAPVYYFRYLAEGDAEILRGVFIHNEYDILSLAGLSIHFSRVLSGLLDLNQMVAEEVYRLGLWLAKMEEMALAEQAFQHLLDRSSEECAPYWTPIAAYYKKQGQVDLSIEMWTMATDYYRAQALRSTEPLIELAMHFEHKIKDYNKALQYAEEALACMKVRTSFFRPNAKHKAEVEAIKKRIERLRLRADQADLKEAARLRMDMY